ncbi:MAG: hypothetical protein NE334_20565 [Lentisphaeraceae bacterium]|nr:hypothetical protein [Lentisphaeraceae bacterium]
MKFLGSMSIYKQIAYHRLMGTFGAKTGGAMKSSAPKKDNSLLQKDWKRKGQTHA